jgi:hypothetical protein
MICGNCTVCHTQLYVVELSVVSDPRPRTYLTNDNCYTSDAPEYYLAERGRASWIVEHRRNVKDMSFFVPDAPRDSPSMIARNVRWLDVHWFGLMAWADPWNKAVQLVDTMLPLVRRIRWPEDEAPRASI